jgi:hypothetical protein
MQIINPAVRSAAELYTDGKITDRTLADVAAMKGLPLYVEIVAQGPNPRDLAEKEVIDARAALKSAVEKLAWVERGKAAFDTHDNGPGDFRHGKFPVWMREARDGLAAAQTRVEAADIEMVRVWDDLDGILDKLALAIVKMGEKS